jgi:RimJ/RimL family protein N-acetyltransferase
MMLTTITTSRLILRPLRRDDLDALGAILGDPIGMGFYPHAFSRAESLEWIERDIARYDDLGFGHLAIELTETGTLIGDCGPTILDVEGVDEVELGWHVRRDLWSRGYATEAAIATRDWMFDGRNLDRLISLVRPENVASCRVAEKIGMTVERDVDRRGIRHHIYAMTPADRRTSPPRLLNDGAAGPRAAGSSSRRCAARGSRPSSPR